MALNISAWSIRNPLPSIVFSIILLVLGWVSFTKLAVTRLPSADIPVISVAVSQFGGRRSEEHTSALQSHSDLVCRLLLDKNSHIVGLALSVLHGHTDHQSRFS